MKTLTTIAGSQIPQEIARIVCKGEFRPDHETEQKESQNTLCTADKVCGGHQNQQGGPDSEEVTGVRGVGEQSLFFMCRK